VKFRHIPAVGRTIIVAVAVGVFAIAAVACATSYNAIYRLVGMLGLYGEGITKAFPLMLDVAFIVAELAAILGGIMRAVTRSDEVTKGWPNTTMLLCGGGTIAFNVAHAFLIGGRHDPLTVWRCVVASLPPILMMVSFNVLIAIVKWVMLHLGRPLNSAAALSPTGGAYGQQQMPPPDAGGEWVGPHPYWSASRPNPQVGQTYSEGSKANAVRGYLRRMTPTQLDRASKKSVTRDLNAQGLEVDETWVQKIMSEPEFAPPKPAGSINGDRRR
jgi:hypothetical protein